MLKNFFALIVLFLATTSWALVDMRNANFSDTWTDIKIYGSGYNLEVVRSYNSRTLFSGIFGFGWCSDFETRLEITPEGSIKATECGAGLNTEYKPKKFNDGKVHNTIDKIMSEVKKRNKGKSDKYFANIKSQLTKDNMLREEFARQLNLKGKVAKGTTYYGLGRANETIVWDGKSYKRTLADGTYENFNKEGLLTHRYDKNQNYVKINYKKDKIVSVTDSDGKKFTFKYHPQSNHVKQISGPGGLVAKYTFKGEQLVSVKNAWKNTFAYSYDDLNNLTKIAFPDKTTKELTYNKDKDWVTSFKNRAGCIETYNYKVNDKDLSYYKSEVTKKCAKKVTNNSVFEFYHKKNTSGVGRYLYKTKAVRNGKESEVVYHEFFGRPVLVYKNGFVTKYKFYETGKLAGLVMLKTEPNRKLYFEYKNKCMKVSRTIATYYELDNSKATKRKVAKKKKVIKTVKTNFKYKSPKCNLIYAENSDGQKVKLGHDRKGRITKIIDQSKKEVKITYDPRFDKPSKITRTGLGTIKVSYKKDGSISKVNSKDGPQVAIQVSNVFNNLLEIISPATSEVSI